MVFMTCSPCDETAVMLVKAGRPACVVLQANVRRARGGDDCLQLTVSPSPAIGDDGVMTQHILVVDDDQEIRTLLAEYLERSGLRVSTLADGRELLRALEEKAVDLVVLDLMMPGVDGLTLCREVRAKGRMPVLILSARGEDVDRIVGLEMGADDYLAKPFHPRELLARIKAILARSGAPAEAAPGVNAYRFDAFRLDVVRRVLVRPDGREAALTGAEYELLEIFLAR